MVQNAVLEWSIISFWSERVKFVSANEINRDLQTFNNEPTHIIIFNVVGSNLNISFCQLKKSVNISFLQLEEKSVNI